MAGSRNFLFAPDSPDMALTRLLSDMQRVTGFMQGAPGSPLPGWYAPDRDNGALLQTLHDRLTATYPAARQPFHATRLWTNLIWQPAYLAVIAVHVHGALPRLADMSQAVQGIDVSGFRLAAGPQWRADTEAMIARAGQDLRHLAEGMLAEINAIARLKPLPALRLLADRVLDLMLRLAHFCPGIDQAEQRRFCQLWLAAMDLTGQGTLETLDLDDGSQVLIMARRGCCLDYLALPDTYCSSCPRQEDGVRLRRQRDQAIAERAG